MYIYYSNEEILSKLDKAIEAQDWNTVLVLQEEVDIRNI